MRRLSIGLIAVGLLVAGLCTGPAAFAQQRQVLRSRETEIATVPVEASTGRTFLSPDGKRVAYVLRNVDEDGDYFKVFASGFPTPFAFDRLVSGTPLFSADGAHLVVAGKDGASWFVIHDGRRGKSFTRIWDDSVRLSPRGDRLIYVAEQRLGKVTVVVDGEQRDSYDAVIDGSLCFSPDGAHVAYSALDGLRAFVVLDREPTASFEKVGRPIFSADGAHLGFVAARGGKSTALLDGKPGPVFDSIDAESLQFAPDAERIAYVATVGTKRQAVVGDKPVGDAYPWIFSDSLVFSSDAKRVSFAARVAGMMTVVVDGKEEPAYRSIVPGSIRFSPDGRRIAYIAERPGMKPGENLRVMIVDGVEGAPYRWIRGAPVFSADSKRVGYIAQRPASGGEGWVCFLVLDGIEGTAYPWIRGQPTLSVDGSRAVFIAAAPDERFKDADETPWNPDAPAAGGRLTLDARIDPSYKDSLQKAAFQEPIRIVAVDERLTPE